MSAPNLDSQTSDTLHARTDDVSGQSQLEIEVPISSAHDTSTEDRAVVVEAQVTSIHGEVASAADPQTDETIQATGTGHQESEPPVQPSLSFMNLGMDVEEFQLESSDSEGTQDDQEMVDASVHDQLPSFSDQPLEPQVSMFSTGTLTHIPSLQTPPTLSTIFVPRNRHTSQPPPSITPELSA